MKPKYYIGKYNRKDKCMKLKKAKDPINWEDKVNSRVANWKEKGFDISVEQVMDEHPDTSYLGEYSDDGSKPHAIERPNATNREFKYFIPANPEYGEQDMERMESLNNGNWFYLGIVAKVYKYGVELGYDSLWGIESDSSKDYIDDTARDVVGEAIAQAKEKIKELIKGEK